MATLPLIGMYNYDPHIFDGLTFPEGIDKEIAVNEILTRSGEFEVIYPDVAFLTAMITHWGKKHYRTFDKWVAALAVEYNPLENYDRHEETSDETYRNSGYKTSADYTDKRTANLEDKRTADLNEKTTYLNDDTTSQTVDGTVQHDVAAYDSGTLVAQSKDTTNSGTSKLSHTGTVDLDTDGTDTLSHTGTDETRRAGTLSDTNGNESEAFTHTSHLYGNIGVTTSQQMLQAELDVQRFNLYENIANLFIDEFCVLVY